MPPAPATKAKRHPRRAFRFPALLFATALLIRWAYDIVLFATSGTPGLMGVDSLTYIGSATTFAAEIARGGVTGLGWLGPNPSIMPLFNGLLTLAVLGFGALAPLVFVVAQGAVDAATCVVVLRLAGDVDERLGKPAAMLAAVNPTQIVLAGLVYTDTLFLFFSALSLLGALRWLRSPSWRDVVLTSLALGAAALTRVLVIPWAGALLIFLIVVAVLRRGLWARAAVQLAACSFIFCLCVGPVALRNAGQHDTWSLSSQGGVHLNLWVVPLIIEARDGIPWSTSFEEMNRRKTERFPVASANPFIESEQHREIAMEELRRLDWRDIARAWFYGAVINLVSPAIIIAPPVQTLPRTGFFATPGGSMPDKIANFLFRAESALYVWILLTGAAGVAAMRALQTIGTIAMLRQRLWPELLLLGGWCTFILIVNGPIASPKYRLPIEPVLMLAAAAGVVSLRSWLGSVGRS